jgi:hypothetical protein
MGGVCLEMSFHKGESPTSCAPSVVSFHVQSCRSNERNWIASEM